MTLTKTKLTMPEKIDGCCTILNPDKWEDKMHMWNCKPFIMSSVPAFFHVPYMPLMRKHIIKMLAQADIANRLLEDDEALLLFMDPHPFKSNIFLSVTGPVPNAHNVKLSGRFQSNVFEGGFKTVSSSLKTMRSQRVDKSHKIKNLYVHYAYCPECSIKADPNYHVIFAELN